jgi:hypothetical protein
VCPGATRSLVDNRGFVRASGGRFVFDIDVKFPILGQLVHYRGWLAQK